ncbi:MAG: ABC transporter ATP-binding protein/permease [Oscillibacter sp.]
MIVLQQLSKKYGDTVLLDHADYTFPPTGLVCLMGPSGGGKTTLFNLLAGFDSEYEGTITVGGTALGGMDPEALCAYRRDHIGFVFQNYHLLPGYTALENVMLPWALSGDSYAAGAQKARALLSRLGLAEKEQQACETLSGGQKQRVAIARALLGDPPLLFADEPTGALDRKSSTEIMALLREISVDKLVVVITHDEKIGEFADEIIRLAGQKIVAEGHRAPTGEAPRLPVRGKTGRAAPFARAVKNFRVHGRRYLAASLAIALGLLAFLASLSFGNVVDRSVTAFQEKNTALHSGYLKGADDGAILRHLLADPRIETAYHQYPLEQITLSLGENTRSMAEKFPTSKATEALSYGVMPRRGAMEISLSPSLAKQFSPDVQALLGQTLTLGYDGREYDLTISGIFNAGYDDFFVSADVEQALYANLSGQDNYAITYEVGAFDQIVPVDNALRLGGLNPQTAAKEVYAMQNTFRSLSRLFFAISVLVLAIGLFICTILLVRLQNSRYHELGLLSALGFPRRSISAMITVENGLLSALATLLTLALTGCVSGLSALLQLPFSVTGTQVLVSALAAFAVVLVLSGGASWRLLRTEPGAALRK